MSDPLEQAMSLLARTREEQAVVFRDAQVAMHGAEQAQRAHLTDVQRLEDHANALQDDLGAAEKNVHRLEGLLSELREQSAKTEEALQSRVCDRERNEARLTRELKRAVETGLMLYALLKEVAQRPVALEEAKAHVGELERELAVSQQTLKREEAMRVSFAEQLMTERRTSEQTASKLREQGAREAHQHKRKLQQTEARLEHALDGLSAMRVRAEGAEQHMARAERAMLDHAARSG